MWDQPTNQPTDQLTDQLTNGRTDIAGCRVARTQTKIAALALLVQNVTFFRTDINLGHSCKFRSFQVILSHLMSIKFDESCFSYMVMYLVM